MIKIDQGKCIGCLKCVAVCPFNVLKIKDGRPDFPEGSSCIKCLHCAAACPQLAIGLDEIEGVVAEELPKMPENFSELMEGYLMTRRSYRHFKSEPVPKEILEQALSVSAWAPSAKNQHPVKWVVVSDANKIRSIMDHILEYVKEAGISPEVAKLYEQGKNVVLGNAPTLILAYCRTDAVNPFTDTALALYNVELMLQSKEFGTCWAGYLMRFCNQIPALREMLNLPEGCQFYGALLAGSPKNEEYLHIPNRHKMPKIQWI
ncbi:MAG: nitroreductase family protein [Clostridia bacterium]|nr:nitroreductase family protein [Clostridia bacterium]